MKVFIVSEEDQYSCCYGVTNVGVDTTEEKGIEMAERHYNKHINNGNKKYSITKERQCPGEVRVTFKLESKLILKNTYLISEYEIGTEER